MIELSQGQEAYLRHLTNGAADSRVMAILESDDAGAVTVQDNGREVGQVILVGFRPCEIGLFDLDNGAKGIAFITIEGVH